jgi:hypothetical protein
MIGVAKARTMRIEYDGAKNRRNMQRHGIFFAAAKELLSGPHATRQDTRRDYGERRIIAYGLIGGRMHVCVYTLRGTPFVSSR